MSDLIPELRMKSILQYLAEADDIVTVKQIADEIGVSRRTVLREMPEVEEWLKANQFELLKKPGQGVKLSGDDMKRARLREILCLKSSGIINMPKDRQKMLLVELLQQKEPVKIYYYTSKLGVSASTISNDLDKAEGWLKKYNLTLVRKTGYGVYLTGEERDFRRAMISLLYENLSEEELIKIMKDNVPSIQKKTNVLQVNVRNRLLNLIDRESVEKIENTVYRLEGKLTYKLTESARIGLMVHMALAIQRIKNNENISIDSVLLGELRKVNEFVFANDIAKEVEEEFNIMVPEDEVGYITMHLKGARAYNDSVREGKLALNEETIEIAKEMIDIVEKEFGIELEKNDKVLRDLVSHLDPAIRRLELNLDIRNPILGKLKQLFPEVYKISERAAEILKKRVNKEIPESEIGFIAMHFGAAIEKKKTDSKKTYRVVVACPSGIGSSRLLSARLGKEFADLEIIDVVSTSDIKEEWYEENKVDLIVSTIPIENCRVKNVCVNPLLLEEDKLLIQQLIRKTKQKDKKADIHYKSVEHLKNNLTQAVDYCNFISEVLENHNVFIDSSITDMSEFTRSISELLSGDEEERKTIIEVLNNIDEFILLDECLLLNCYIKEAKQSSLLFCRLDREFIKKYYESSADMAMILFVPEKRRDTYKYIVEDFKTFVGSNANMKKYLRSANPNEINEKLYEILSELYMSKLYEWRMRLHS